MDKINIEQFFSSGLALGIYVFIVLLIFLWIVLPFAVFGIKGRVDELIEEQKITNELLNRILKMQQPDQEEEDEIKIDFEDRH